jgi:hypothetical protein
MPELLLLFLRGLGWFAGGVAATSLVDKFIPDKLPAGVAPIGNISDSTGKINWLKVVFSVVIGAIGILIVRKVAKMLNIKFLK